MKVTKNEKELFMAATCIMVACLAGLVTLGMGGYLCLIGATEKRINIPSPPALPLAPPITEPASEPTTESMTGLWQRTDIPSGDLIIFTAVGPNGYGIFQSSVDGRGTWVPGSNSTIFLIQETGLIQISVSFPEENTMIVVRQGGTQTWSRVASIM